MVNIGTGPGRTGFMAKLDGILAIDPGDRQSAYAFYSLQSDVVVTEAVDNDVLRRWLMVDHGFRVLAIESVANYGMAVGRNVLDTAFWAGRFVEAFVESIGRPYQQVLRKGRWGPGQDDLGAGCVHDGVLMTLCHSTRAKDSNVRQALIDLFGGQAEAIGNVKCPKCYGRGWAGRGRPPCPKCRATGWQYAPGPLASVTGDGWSALALLVTYAEATST